MSETLRKTLYRQIFQVSQSRKINWPLKINYKQFFHYKTSVNQKPLLVPTNNLFVLTPIAIRTLKFSNLTFLLLYQLKLFQIKRIFIVIFYQLSWFGLGRHNQKVNLQIAAMWKMVPAHLIWYLKGNGWLKFEDHE